jgi:hypothetical protein
MMGVDGLACIPFTEIVVQQEVKVVIRYMEAHPETLHEPLSVLAINALSETWPCKKR